MEHTQRESAQELESHRPNEPEQPQPDGQGSNVDLVVIRRGSGWRRMLVTVTGSQVRKIWGRGRRDVRPRHFRSVGSSLADAHMGLLTHQAGVRAIGGDQLIVSPHLHGPAFIQNQDAIGVYDARKTVSNDQRRSVLHQSVERTLDDGLVLSIHAGERLIQEENRGIF